MKFDQKTFQFNNLDDAPDKPGIYAWYAKADLGIADWQREIDAVTKEDFGTENFKRALQEHSLKFDPPRLSISATSVFSISMQGELVSNFPKTIDSVIQGNFDDTKDKDHDQKKINRAIATEGSRQNITDILNIAQPQISAPIYIGKSLNLKTRLKTHCSEIKKLITSLAEDSDYEKKIQEYLKEDGSKFSVRAVANDFKPENLYVITLSIDTIVNDKNKTDIDSIITTSEWLLNRWNRPILGKI
jgi:hypothetical protein